MSVELTAEDASLLEIDQQSNASVRTAIEIASDSELLNDGKKPLENISMEVEEDGEQVQFPLELVYLFVFARTVRLERFVLLVNWCLRPRILLL